MRLHIIHYLIVLSVFLAIDFLWLSTIGRSFYVQEIGTLLRDRPQLGVAFAFYALYALGLMFFVIEPAVGSELSWRTLAIGGFFGLIAYATYDLTNLATIKGFTWRVALVDMLWGAALSAAVSIVSLWVFKVLRLS